LVQFGKLKLSGFKSFVDATELFIDPGMTGIVGPNGCGKSNLVEALRWVMGENSPKRMRGGGMEDVIFNGSSNRPSRNVAEVVLSLDNSDRKAPAHFNAQTEIEVSRRIERGEGSAYRVNGKEVRARDVQLLFADSATGAHSTALVSQGRVGALINAKPIERRALLEEAAGITGLHSRRHEAELRLKAAETNLERLDDIVATLESQLQGLKKQARQASRYRNLARHIRRHEALLLHLQGLKARRAKAAAEAQLAEAERNVGALMENTASAATDQAEAAAALPELRQVEADAATALQRLLAERTALEQEEARVTAAQDQAAQRLSQIESDQQRAKTLSDDAAAAQNRLAEERDGLEAAIEGEADLRSAAQEAFQAARATLNTTENALSAKASELAAEEARDNAVERRAQELADRIARLRGQLEAVEQEREALGRAQQDEGELKSAELAVGQVEILLATRKSEAEAASAALADAREAESAAREAWRQAETERSRLEAEISALAVLLEPKESEIWPPLVDAVTVETGYEAALGAALGDDLDAPADEAAPIHWAALGDILGALDLPQGARSLSEFVRAPDVLSRRLSQIGVVADLATGARLQKQLSPGQRLVTRDGALWRWDGFAARPDAPTGAAARLAQRTRLADLRQQMGRATETADTLRDRLDSRAAAAQSAAENERLAREAQASAYAEMDQTRQSYARLSQASAAAASRRSALGETAQRLREELDDSETAQEQNEADRTALPQLETLRAALQALRSQAELERNELADRQAEVARLERERESRQQRLTAIGEEAALWERRTAEATQHLSELAERWQETGAEIESLKALPAEIEERRSTLAERVDAAEAERKAAMDTLAVSENRLAEADKALRGAEQKLAQAREERVRAEGANEQADQALTLFRERVRERLECQLDQLAEVAEIDPSQDLPAEEEIEMKLARLTRERENMGAVNLLAEQEAEEVGQQIDALQTERTDLVSAIARLRQGIAGLNKEARARLLSAFEDVNRHFSELFVSLFGGGRAHLALTEADDPLEAGLEIMASPPGKRLQVMTLLSGGEQALTALSLLFAVFLTNPAPICVLDEVDAPLDDANVDRFCTLVQDLAGSTKTRFLIITHHRMTMARMDRLYGVTMSERGVSQLVSVDLGVAERLRETA
jgi:chromosome segregation protein